MSYTYFDKLHNFSGGEAMGRKERQRLDSIRKMADYWDSLGIIFIDDFSVLKKREASGLCGGKYLQTSRKTAGLCLAWLASQGCPNVSSFSGYKKDKKFYQQIKRMDSWVNQIFSARPEAGRGWNTSYPKFPGDISFVDKESFSPGDAVSFNVGRKVASMDAANSIVEHEWFSLTYRGNSGMLAKVVSKRGTQMCNIAFCKTDDGKMFFFDPTIGVYYFEDPSVRNLAIFVTGLIRFWHRIAEFDIVFQAIRRKAITNKLAAIKSIAITLDFSTLQTGQHIGGTPLAANPSPAPPTPPQATPPQARAASMFSQTASARTSVASLQQLLVFTERDTDLLIPPADEGEEECWV